MRGRHQRDRRKEAARHTTQTAHTAPPHTHQHTNTAQAPPPPHAPTPGRPSHRRAAHPRPHTRAHSKGATGPSCPPHRRVARGGRAPNPRRPHTTARGTSPGDTLPPHPQRATPARKRARCGAGPGSPRPHQPRPGDTVRGAPAARAKRRAAGGGTVPDTRGPSQRWKATLPGRPPATPAARSPPQGMQAKGTGLGPHARTRASTANGQRTPTARPEDGKLGEDERLTSDAPRNGARQHPPRGRPPATPLARNTSSQERTLWGRSSRPQHPRPGNTGRGAPAARPKGRAAGGGTAPDNRRPSERWKADPPGRPPITPAARSPQPTCKPKGQCWAPTAAHARPEHVGSGPRQPASRAGSRGRTRA